MGFPKDQLVRFNAECSSPPGETAQVIRRWLTRFWQRSGDRATLQDFLDSLPRDPMDPFYVELPAARNRTPGFTTDPRRFIAGYVVNKPFGEWVERGKLMQGGFFLAR